MKFERLFTTQPDDIVWSKRDARITDNKGNVVFELQNVEAPSTWSDNAVNIVASKYFKKINGIQETSVKQLISRVVNTIVQWGLDGGYFYKEQYSTEYPADVFAEELTWILTNQYACFNSPIWFNFGVPGREQQAAACFLLGLEDTSESIRNCMSVESKIFKGGSGSGINLTPLRHKNAPLSAGGVSSGPMSFAKAYDSNAGVWKSGGVTRRAATLRRMDVTHKDIEEFITCKAKEERKAKILIAAGYDDGIDGEAYSTVAFQNMNHSVGVTDRFMEKVVANDPEATRLMRLMAQCAWESGDPGIQYDDTINSWNTIPNSGKITTSNPCGEYLSTDWSSCLLASFNLLKFKENYEFNYTKFAHVVHIFTTALDIIIGRADYPDERFRETAHKQRQIGLGYSNLGALLMSMGLAYGSSEGRRLAKEITSAMTAESYIQSARLADLLGPFEDFAKNKQAMLSVVQKHKDMAFTENLITAELWQTALEQGKLHGYRVATNTLIAPTGTISFMMDCDTTGGEPDIALVKYKRLVGGGTMQIVNQSTRNALHTLEYTTDQKNKIIDHITATGTIENCPLLDPKHLPVFDCSLKPANGVRSIHYTDHVNMLAAIQPYLSMGISKTINMPNESTVQDIYDVYVDSWRMGIKSIAVYRDGSKSSQPLNVSNAKEVIVEEKCVRKPLPATRTAIAHKFEIDGFEGYLHIGLYDNGQPGEIFIRGSKQGSTVSGLLDSFAIALSFALQYGVPIELLAEKFMNTRFEPSGFTKNPETRLCTSIPDYIFRWLNSRFVEKKAEVILPIPIMESSSKSRLQTGETCKICGAMLVRTGTCLSCSVCGNAGGCG